VLPWALRGIVLEMHIGRGSVAALGERDTQVLQAEAQHGRRWEQSPSLDLVEVAKQPPIVRMNVLQCAYGRPGGLVGGGARMLAIIPTSLLSGFTCHMAREGFPMR
jgi:hypothetical protein